MARPKNRSQLMAYFGAEQRNSVWSWCAVNEEEKKVYLSIWTDFRGVHGSDGRVSYIVQEPHWGIKNDGGSKSPSRNDHDEKLSRIFDQGYKAYGYFVVAKDKSAVTREIETTRTDFVFSLELERLDDGRIIGHPLDRIDVI